MKNEPNPGLNSSNILLDLCLQRSGVGTDELVNFLSVFENNERRHGPNSVFLSDVTKLVDINLEIVRIRIVFGEFYYFGRNKLHMSTLFKRIEVKSEKINIPCKDHTKWHRNQRR